MNYGYIAENAWVWYVHGSLFLSGLGMLAVVGKDLLAWLRGKSVDWLSTAVTCGLVGFFALPVVNLLAALMAVSFKWYARILVVGFPFAGLAFVVVQLSTRLTASNLV